MRIQDKEGLILCKSKGEFTSEEGIKRKSLVYWGDRKLKYHPFKEEIKNPLSILIYYLSIKLFANDLRPRIVRFR